MNYPYVRAWCNWVSSFHDYTQREVALAEKDKAPENAIYRDETRWYTVDDIKTDDTRNHIETLAELYMDKQPKHLYTATLLVGDKMSVCVVAANDYSDAAVALEKHARDAASSFVLGPVEYLESIQNLQDGDVAETPVY